MKRIACHGMPAGSLLRRRTAILLIGVLGLNACYTSRPLTGGPSVNTGVMLDLTDEGRAVYADRIGASIRSVGGRVEAVSDSAYVVRVDRVWYQNGKTDRWAGESVSFAPRYVAGVRQHELSRTRTALAAAVAVAGVAAAVALIALIGSVAGSEGGDPDKGGPGEF